jgi:hypothetical protein
MGVSFPVMGGHVKTHQSTLLVYDLGYKVGEALSQWRGHLWNQLEKKKERPHHQLHRRARYHGKVEIRQEHEPMLIALNFFRDHYDNCRKAQLQ